MTSDEEWGQLTAQFFAENYQRLYRLAMYLCRNQHNAEDLLSVTMVKVAESWFSARKQTPGWAATIMRNAFKDDLKKRDSRHREVPLQEGQPGWIVDDPAVMALNREQAQIFVEGMTREELAVFAGVLAEKTYEQIAAELGCRKSKVGKVRQRYRDRAAAAGLDIEDHPKTGTRTQS